MSSPIYTMYYKVKSISLHIVFWIGMKLSTAGHALEDWAFEHDDTIPNRDNIDE